MKRRKTKRRKRFRRFLVLLILFAAIAAGVLLIPRVKKVTVKGTTFSNPKEIERWVLKDVPMKSTILSVIMGGQKKESYPPLVSGIRVTLKGFDRIEVQVTETKMLGYVKRQVNNIYFDESGCVMKKTPKQYSDVFRFSGLEISDAEVGKKLKTDDPLLFDDLSALSLELKEQKLAPSLIRIKGDEITLIIKDITIQLGSGNYVKKTEFLPEILEKLSGKKGILHFEKFENSIESVYFEEMNAKKNKKTDKSID